ncbi:MAG TPA: hypothetical protein VGC53_18380 [Vicinamibacteria bacterium]
MKRKLSPQEKKRLAYDRDHVSLGWHSASSFRKGWRKKEAAAEQAHRRAWSVATQGMAQSKDPDFVYPEGRIRRTNVRKTKPPSVRELVATKLERRLHSHGLKAERAKTHAASTAAALERFLGDLLKMKVVARMERLRNIENFVAEEAKAVGWTAKMVTNYLRKHPIWETRLRKWRRALLERKGVVQKRKTNRR